MPIPPGWPLPARKYGLPSWETEVQNMIEKLVQSIRAAGKAAGTVAYNHEALARAKERGFQYIVHSVGPMLTKSAREYLELARQT